jgi:hypothetical protein
MEIRSSIKIAGGASMKNIKIAITTTVIALILLVLVIGCGDGTNYTHNAPDGAIITFSPTTLTFQDIPAVPGESVTAPITIRVRDGFNNPLNGIKVIIDGSWAYPNGLYAYYFIDGSNNVQSSGFTGVTDAAGVYNFTLSIPSTWGTGTVAFVDTIQARSGSVFGSLEIKFNQ